MPGSAHGAGTRLGLPTLLCTFAAALPAAPASGQQAAADRPDVLFIVVDDLNTWIGSLGEHAQTHTPHIDTLASQGVLFENAHCPAPYCNPSRAAVMTGIPPHISGVYSNFQPFREATPHAVTIAQYFRRNGYRTVRVGKLFHNAFPDPTSWDESFNQIWMEPPPPVSSVRIEKLPQLDWGATETAEEETSDARVVSWAVDRLGEPRRRPLFMAVGLNGPHLPWHVPATDLDRLDLEEIALPDVLADDLADVPQAGRVGLRRSAHAQIVERGEWRPAVRAYLASIALVDRQVGRLLEALETSDRAENTVIVLWSDHGIHLGQKQHWGKGTLWDDSTHVPLIVQTPRHRAGTRVTTPVSLMDLYPTLIDLCSLPGRKNIAGQTLVPLLDHPERERRRPALSTAGPGSHAVRSERWRYVRFSDGAEELYDHANDPHEWRNLAGEPGYEEVKRKLASWFPQTNAPPAPTLQEENAERRPDEPPGRFPRQTAKKKPKKRDRSEND